jgi:hypothetical protein
MTMYGANPDELERLGTTLQQQITAIDTVMAAVTQTLAGTTWLGPARERFETDWNGSFRSVLLRLNDAFAAAGADCTARARDLRRVMGT